MSVWPAPSASMSAVLLAPPVPVDTTEPLAQEVGQTTKPRSAGPVAFAIARFLALSWTFTIIWLAVWSLLPIAAGWAPTPVVSGSMEPSLPVGSIVHVDDDVDLASIGVGAIITFDDPAIPGMRVTHRVTGIEETDGEVIGFRTKGDANLDGDTAVVPVENVHGVARLVVPLGGMPKAWAENGNWVALLGFVLVTFAAAVVAIDTINEALGRSGRRPRRRRRAAIGLAIAVMLGAPSTGAAFTGSSSNLANSWASSPQWWIDAVERSSPVAHWRLGEPPGGPPATVLTDDFESFTGYNNYGTGDFVSSTAVARSGLRSGLKTSNNDPNGGWKLLPATVTGSFAFEVWVYRPSTYTGGPIDRIGLEDGGFNGYSFAADHNGNTLRIDRRTGGAATAIGTTVPFDPPEDAWYRLELVRNAASMTLSVYDGVGTLLATTSANDATTTTFDRLVVRGGREYHVDDLTVQQTAPSVVAVDRIGTLDGAYVGTPTLGVPGLVTSDPDTASDLDGVSDAVLLGDSALINTSVFAARTTELWFEADTLVGRQVIYEEGGGTNGFNVYLDGNVLYVTAWGRGAPWSNSLITSTVVAPNTRYHVVGVLDASVGRLDTYVDGTLVDSATKTDSNTWPAHSDDGAIGRVNGATRYHDGNSSASNEFDGTVDEVVLYNTALGAAVVFEHWLAGS